MGFFFSYIFPRSNVDELASIDASDFERNGQRAGVDRSDAAVLHKSDGCRSDQANTGQTGADSGDLSGKSKIKSFYTPVQKFGFTP